MKLKTSVFFVVMFFFMGILFPAVLTAAGTTTADLLLFQQSWHSKSMVGAGTATMEWENMDLNPASLSSINTANVAFFYTRYYSFLNHFSCNFGMPLKFCKAAVHFTLLNSNSEMEIDQNGVETGVALNYGAYMLGIAFAIPIMRSLSVGIDPQYFNYTVGTKTAQAFLLNTGVLYATGKVSMALSLRNIKLVQFKGTAANQKFPLSARCGTELKLLRKGKTDVVSVCLDGEYNPYEKWRFDDGLSLYGGLKIAPVSFLNIRTGYQFAELKQRNLAAGIDCSIPYGSSLFLFGYSLTTQIQFDYFEHSFGITICGIGNYFNKKDSIE